MISICNENSGFSEGELNSKNGKKLNGKNFVQFYNLINLKYLYL